MKRIHLFAFIAAALFAAATTTAQQKPESKSGGREGGSMMDSCREMMKDGAMMGESRPNERWRKSEPAK